MKGSTDLKVFRLSYNTSIRKMTNHVELEIIIHGLRKYLKFNYSDNPIRYLVTSWNPMTQALLVCGML